MAAPSQGSPSGANETTNSRSIQAASNDENLKAPPPSSALQKPPPPAAATTSPTAAAAAAAASPTASNLPTYESVQTSTTYVTAKALLNEGEFEPALQLLEQGIQAVLHQLTSTSTSNNNDPEAIEAAVHPSLAPLHYLYGTTLLYSLEESTTEAMMMTPGNSAEESTEDVQIAYENLETARVLLTKYLDGKDDGSHENDTTTSSSSSTSDTTTTTLSQNSSLLPLDLAQIHLRLGDLFRLQGDPQQARPEYQRCLQLRQRHAHRLEQGPWSRPIADAHYNLALCHGLLACGSTESSGGSGGGTTEDAAAATLASSQPQEKLDRDEHRRQQFVHYEHCALILAAQLAHVAGHANVEEFLTSATSDPLPETNKDDDGTSTAAQSPAGLQRDPDETTADDPQQTATAARLRGLQRAVRQLPVPPAAADLGATLTELLDEILETVQEARTSERGVQQVAALKAQLQAAVAAGDAAAVGTGAASNDANPGDSSAAAFGSAAAAAVSATAQQPTTMMVRKKKKKRPASNEEDVKMPPAKKKPPPPTE